MATLALGAVGGAIGGAFGGSAFGLSGAVLGRAAGAAAGRRIDARLLGGAADSVSTGRIDRVYLNGASEGDVIPRIFGRVRVGGHVIWASPFTEHRHRSGGGKSGPRIVEHGYSVSLALALCEGPVRCIGRVWADGRVLAVDEVSIRLHRGTEDQLPDALIEAAVGPDEAPAYRGTAYVVIEDLNLAPFGNRIPHFAFEVVRSVEVPGEVPPPQELVRGVSIIPGSGEFAYATRRVDQVLGPGRRRVANVHSPAEVPDFTASLRQLRDEVPGLQSASLVVAWFGDDLRVGDCRLRPMVETADARTEPWSWSVCGVERATAAVVPQRDGRPVYGGTPDDQSVVQAIRALRDDGLDVSYHPFILMTQGERNGLPDPTGEAEQPAYPWRGRITSGADGTDMIPDEIANFFGAVSDDDFAVGDGAVRYTGNPDDWGFRRFVLHQAALCAAAGGVEGFVIGSEMRGVTTLRDAAGDFPAVNHLRSLAAAVRRMLPEAKIGYAADWTEYGGHRPDDGSGDVRFHLDPLWADDAIDFVGIDNYAPVADWRDGADHADATWGSGHDLGYLQANVEGGEAYDWFYADASGRQAQVRLPITDDAHGEPWVHRAKDVRNWWSNRHHDRIGGVRSAEATAWRPGMKPVRFVEYGCAAVDKGANEPSRFPDPKSSEGGMPHFSNGHRDDAVQMQYVRALLNYWGMTGRNPESPETGLQMLDLDHSFLWAWDARPWPAFPDDETAWGDAANYETGHWWTGRSTLLPLASVIASVCADAGVECDVGGVRGVVRGMVIEGLQSARADLEALLAAHAVEAVQQGDRLVFRMRADAPVVAVATDDLVREGDRPVRETIHEPENEAEGRALIHHIDADGSFRVRVSEALRPDGSPSASSESELPMSMTASEGVALAARQLAEARLGRDTISVAVPPSRRDVAAGDLLCIDGSADRWRVDRVDDGAVRRLAATLADPSVLTTRVPAIARDRANAYAPTTAVDLIALELPGGDAMPGQVRLAATADPWPGPVAVLGSDGGGEFSPDAILSRPAVTGLTETALHAGRTGVVERGAPLIVRVGGGLLRSIGSDALSAGGNLCAVGSAEEGWEMLQFATAVPVSPDVWALSDRIRGLHGSDAEMLPVREPGVRFVLLDDAVGAIARAPGVARGLRYGPARFDPGHGTWRETAVRPEGIAQRPLAPVHLRCRRDGATDEIAWVRRSRAAGESWDRPVPVVDAAERYAVRVTRDGAVVWSGKADGPAVRLDRAVVGQRYSVAVAQVSDLWGEGPPGVLTVA